MSGVKEAINMSPCNSSVSDAIVALTAGALLTQEEPASMGNQLTAPERSDLRVCEKSIQSGIKQVGESLLLIRDEKLYREKNKTFEAYCQDEWGFGRSYVNKLITAEETKAVLGTIVPKNEVPQTESHLREIAKAPEKNQVEVFERGNEIAELESRKPIASDYEQAVDEIEIDKNYEDVPEDEPEQGIPVSKPKKREPHQCPLCNGCGQWTADREFPLSLEESDSFMLAWGQWIAYRIEKKKTLTKSSIALQLKLCDGMGIDAAIESIETSIKNGWVGLFSPDEKGKSIMDKMNDQGF